MIFVDFQRYPVPLTSTLAAVATLRRLADQLEQLPYARLCDVLPIAAGARADQDAPGR